MKTKKSKKQSKHFHEHLDTFFRLRLCLLLAAGLLPLAFSDLDDETAAITTGHSEVQSNLHMNEERLHSQATVHVLRLPTTSGK